jgi:hypothetical protein
VEIIYSPFTFSENTLEAHPLEKALEGEENTLKSFRRGEKYVRKVFRG